MTGPGQTTKVNEPPRLGTETSAPALTEACPTALRISARAGRRTHTVIVPATYQGWRDAWNECVAELGKDAQLTEQRILPGPVPDRRSPSILERLALALRWAPRDRRSLERW